MFYFCHKRSVRSQQIASRRVREAQPSVSKSIAAQDVLPDELKAAIVLFFSLLDEQQRRLYAALESFKLGYGGDRKMADILGLDVSTVARGRRELLEHDVKVDRVRRAGAGRKLHRKKTPEVIARIEELMKYETAGDPVSGLRWTRKTTEKIADELLALDIRVSRKTVAKLLKAEQLLTPDQQKEDLEWLSSRARRPVRHHRTAAGALWSTWQSHLECRHQKEGVGRALQESRTRLGSTERCRQRPRLSLYGKRGRYPIRHL